MISIMCLDAKVKFLTFVVVLKLLSLPGIALAAPSTDVAPSGIVLNDENETFFPRKPITDTTDFSVGFAEGIFAKDESRDSMGFFSIGRTHYQENKTAYDYKLDLTSKTFLGLDLGYRWVFPEILREEPYVRIGATILLDPKDQIGNFIDYKRYYLQAALGFDSLFRSRRSIKIEAGGRAGIAGTHFFASITYSLTD